MIDLRLYRSEGKYVDPDKTSEHMQLSNPDDPVSKGMEVIANKVVKFMLTQKGSDAFNPRYGGTSMHYLQISQQFLPQLRREVAQDVQNCLKFIAKADMAHNTDDDRLLSINILKVAYDPSNAPNRVDVYLELITRLGKHAVVAINSRTGT